MAKRLPSPCNLKPQHEKVVEEIEAEEKRAADTLNKIKGKIAEAIGTGATDEQIAQVMQRLK